MGSLQGLRASDAAAAAIADLANACIEGELASRETRLNSGQSLDDHWVPEGALWLIVLLDRREAKVANDVGHGATRPISDPCAIHGVRALCLCPPPLPIMASLEPFAVCPVKH